MQLSPKILIFRGQLVKLDFLILTERLFYLRPRLDIFVRADKS